MFRLVLVLLSLQIAAAQLPLGWKPCKMGSSDYKKCISHQMEFAIASLKNGDKKLGVLPIDPLTFKGLHINQASGPVAIKLSLMNFTFSGLSKCKVIDIKNDWKELTTKMYYDMITTKGDYKIGGKILILPIQGEGPCTMNWHNMTVDTKIMFKEVNRKGKTFFEIPQFLVNIQPKKLTLKFDNLFNGDKALGDNMNLFLNENWEEIINELRPAITTALSQGFAQVGNQVFSKVPKERLYVK